MRVLVTGGAGFIGGAVVRHLLSRGDAVTCIVRDPTTAAEIASSGAFLVARDLGDKEAIAEAATGQDAVIHVAGRYRIGIARSERAEMWDANVGATERVLDAASAAGVGRIVYVSTGNVYGNTRGTVVDETYRRDITTGWLSAYDETKYRAHEAAETRIAAGAPIVVLLPSGVYGPGDHFVIGQQLEAAFRGRLRSYAFGDSGLSFAHLDDVADGILRALDRGAIGRSYNLAGNPLRLRDALSIAARVGGHRFRAFEAPRPLLRLTARLGPAAAGAMGLPPNLDEVIRASDGVTYWISAARATAELGFVARSFEQGIRDTFGTPS